MLRTALVIVSGNAFASLVLLLRNLMVARMISVEDYGIAATFAISMAIVELMTQLGLHQLIVQDEKGDDPRLQAGLQGLQLLRGVISAIILFLLARPLAGFLGIPDIAWAYQLLALQPLLMSCRHFDIHRFHRRMVFGPSVLVNVVPAGVSVLAILPLSALVNDYRLMLFAMLIQGVVGLLTSHLVAVRRFEILFDRAIIWRGWIFGWPLMINGALLFAVLNGEKLIVGNSLGMETLALFSMGFTLTLTPTLVGSRSEQLYFLPQLSATRDDRDKYNAIAVATMQTSMMIGAITVLGIALFGAVLIEHALGDKYAGLLPYLMWFAVLHNVRTLKSGCTVVALSQARTFDAMVVNIFRAVSLPVSAYVALQMGDLVMIIWIATLAELLAYGVALILVRVRADVPLRSMVLPLLAQFAFLVTACGFAALRNMDWLAALVVCFTVLLISLNVFWGYFDTRKAQGYAE